MTEVETPEQTTESPVDGSEAARQKGGKEARYRVERNEARAERDALAQRVERFQRAEVERLAADGLSHPADLFNLSGNDLADYLNGDGDVDTEKVAADVAVILSERPGLQKPRYVVGYDPTQGHGGSANVKPKPTFVDLFKS